MWCLITNTYCWLFQSLHRRPSIAAVPPNLGGSRIDIRCESSESESETEDQQDGVHLE